LKQFLIRSDITWCYPSRMTNWAKNRKYKSDAYEAIHSSALGMFRAGAIDKATMREFDEACLSVPVALEPRRIKQIRLSQKVSQPVFARYLNTSESTVEKWETGVKRPSGMALKLLDIVQKHGLKVLA
jgi:putative transcriptional regulator